MPISATQSRTQHGNYLRTHHGVDAPSHRAACHRRFGGQATHLNVRSIRNQLAVALLLSTALPAAARCGAAPAPLARAPGQSDAGSWPPGTLAAPPDIELGLLPDSAAAPAADNPLLQPAPSIIANVASNGALTTCAANPRRCGAALLAAVGLTAFSAAAATTRYLLHRHADEDGMPPVKRYMLDPERLLPPVRFNASELDPGAPPCDSLGAHVNRIWETDSALQRSRTQLGTLDHLRSNALLTCQQLAEQMQAEAYPDVPARVVGDLWATGMDEAGIEVAGRMPLQPTLDAIAALEDVPALTAWLFDASARGANPLFTLSVLPDQLDPSTNLAYLAQSGLGLPDSAWYEAADKKTLVAGYQQHVARTLVLSGMGADDAERLAADILALERALASASDPFAALATDISHFYNPLSPAQAQQQTPHIDWRTFFQAQGVAVPERFSLGMPDFFRRLDALLASTPLETWKAHLLFHATDAAAPCLSSVFVDTHDAFHGGLLKGRRSRVPRFARVMGIIQQEAGDALGPAYAQVAFSAQTERRMQAMTHQLIAALETRLQQCEWMDDSSRRQAMDKINTLRIDVGRPQQWPRWDHVGTNRDSFLGNVQAVRAHAQRRNVALLGSPVDTAHWKLTPQTVDAYQDLSLNRIVIPAAMLQPPLFDPAADDALNYGGIGAVIGHEMAHGYDNIGTTFDAHGKEADWLSAYSRQRFDALSTQLREQFTHYLDAGRAIDSELTLDENLADLGGLAIALQAMQQATAGTPDPMIDGMTREQRFFASHALVWRMISTPERAELERATNNHAPGSVRADGAASNLPQFARAFNCTPGSPMARLPADQVHFL